jgi:co-chaperonin GroES (HSP10)
MGYVPLRGRVIIRQTGDSGGYDSEFKRLGLVLPDTAKFDPRQQRNQNSLGRGIVVAMGPPARDKWGVERAPAFAVGSEVLFIGQHVSRLYMWNGEELRACSQEEVCAVVEPEDPAYASTMPAPPEFGAEGLSE